MPSGVKQSPAAQVKEQHPKGTYAYAEDERGHCPVIHGVLDTLLHAWSLVLVLSCWTGGNRVAIPLTHALCLWVVKRMFGPHHLRSLHHSTV